MKNKQKIIEFVRSIREYTRAKNILCYPEPSKEFLEEIKKWHISYGKHNDIVDLLVLSENLKDLKGLKPRYILSSKDLKLSDFVLSKIQLFDIYGFGLYERKDLIKVACFPVQGKGAVLWYRVQLPVMKIWQKYHNIDIRVVYPANYNDLIWSDIVLIQRWFPEAYGFINYAKHIGKKVIFETDDLDIHIPQENPLYWEYRIGNRIDEIKNLMIKADVVTTTTPQLRNELLVFNNDIKVINNKVDLSMPMWNQKKKPHDGIIIGWVGGSTHYYDLQIVRGFVQQICNRFSNVRFMICGYIKGGVQTIFHEDKETGFMTVKKAKLEKGIWDKIVDEFRKEIGDKLLMVDVMPLEKYGELYTGLDMVVVPLEDNKFCRAKSELKVIEAGVYSLPVVASDLEPYQEIIKHGESGFLAKNRKKWIKYVSRLINNKELREQVGKNLRNTIETKYNADDQSELVNLFYGLRKEK